MKKETLLSAILKSVGYVFLFFATRYLALFLGGLAMSFALLFSGGDLMTDATGSILSVMYEIDLLSGVFFTGILLLILKNKTPERCGFEKTSPSSVTSAFLLGLGCYVAATAFLRLAVTLPQVQSSQDVYMDQYEATLAAQSSRLMEILCIGLVGPFLEEILFRGLILRTLQKVMKPAIAIGLAAVGFALFHGNLYQMVFTLPLGVVLGFLAWRFHSIWPAVFLHAGFNLSNYLVQMGSFLGYSETDPMWVGIAMAGMMFCAFCIPLGLIVLKWALGKEPRPAGEILPQNQIPTVLSENPTEKGEMMAAPEFIVVGLGNPGEKYAMNRHNCGFIALDYLSDRWGISIRNFRFKALCGEGMVNGKKVLFLKPQTFMNLSGEAVAEAARFYHIPPEKILVIFDDINFQPGSFRIRQEGSAGGHNGIKSIISQLGSDAFPRVKMGVGTPPEHWELMNWVLGNFSKDEFEKVKLALGDVESTVNFFVIGQLEQAMQNFNGKIR